MSSMAKSSFKKFVSFLPFLYVGISPMTQAKDQTEFVWLATESAPKNFPMQIMRGGSFIYHDSLSDGLYIPSGGTLYRGWGSATSSHVVGPELKPLPDKLDITFYSYLEDAFYSGKFDLPYDKILSLFRQGVAEDKANPTYRYIMVGIAPGGTVAVWVTGKQSTVEVFFGKAQKANIDWSKAIDYPETKRASFIKSEIEDSVKPEILANIRKNGINFDLWSQYRNQYHWVPTFVGNGQPRESNLIFYNGEKQDLSLPLNKEAIQKSRPVPRYLAFNSLIKGETEEDVFLINFDEQEMLSAFSKLGNQQQPLYLEFSPTLPKPNTKIRLYNDRESVQLTKWKVDVW